MKVNVLIQSINQDLEGPLDGLEAKIKGWRETYLKLKRKYEINNI